MSTSNGPLSTSNVTLVAASRIPAQELQYIFSDSFESGDLSKTENGFGWRNYFTSDIQITTENPKTGTYSMRIRYEASPNVGDDDYVELKTDIGAMYKHLVFEFDLYIPDGTEPWGGARWKHTSDGTADNNKLFRLYNEREELKYEFIGASYDHSETTPGDSRAFAIWSRNGSARRQGSSFELVTDSDRGQWMHLKFDCKMPSRVFEPFDEVGRHPDADGHIKIWKNGSLATETAMNNYVDAPGKHGWSNGYLFGWANAGFREETFMFMDNYEIWGVPA